MASFKLKFRPSTVVAREGVLYMQIIYKRQVRQVKYNYKISKNEWDSERGSIRLFSGDIERQNYLLSVHKKIEMDLQIFKKIDFGQCDSCDEIIEEYHRLSKSGSFLSFMDEVISSLKMMRKYSTSENYESAQNSLKNFLGEEADVDFDGFDSFLMERYEAYLKDTGIRMNTISFYMRILRATYNRGVEQGLAVNNYPFKHVYTGVDKTTKRAISLSQVKKIKDLDLNGNSNLEYVRDLFMFSFYTRGMAYVDIAMLKIADIKYGVITYRRRKTDQELQIKVEKCMAEIIARHHIHGSEYVFPILKEKGLKEWRSYKNGLVRINKGLKHIGEKVGLHVPLTMYVARHTWASVAKSKNVPISVISECMGHDSEKRTNCKM